jgi:predicted nucleic acid-binding protein
MPDFRPITHSIRIVRCGADALEQVIALHGPNRRTLGFFPRGAFEDYARREGILAAVDASGRVLGYIAIRVSAGWTHIAHLCVDASLRRSSIARDLVEHVARASSKHQHLGLRLMCRRDYDANEFWPKVKFVARGQKHGRGVEPSELTVWIRRNADVPDLFSYSGSDDPERRLAVLDANTFYDLGHENDWSDDLPEHVKESLQLCAGWIQDAVELCIVSELFSEIDRRGCADERKKQQLRAHGFRELHHDEQKAALYYSQLKTILGWHKPKPQQASDMKQIANAAAAGATFFVTRDEDLLRASPQIAADLSILILRPSALLTSIDEEGRSDLYSPARLAGTNISVKCPSEEDAKRVLDAFLGRNPQEPRYKFRDLTQRVMAQSAGRSDRLVQLVSDDLNAPVVFVAYCCAEHGNIEVEILRTSTHRLGSTAIRHSLLSVIQKAADLGGRSISIHDESLSRVTQRALEDLYFEQVGNQWTRALHPEIVDLESLDLALGITVPPEGWTDAAVVSLEDRLWPLKIRGKGVPGAVVTINDHWAAKLFDRELARGELFAVDPHRVLNRENVFYRHKDGWPKSEPRRILWYVSRTNTFRACSRLLNVEKAPAFQLFRRYERLGVYGWDDVIRTTDGDPHGDLMAIHFTDTELFDRPVPLDFAKTLGVGKMVAGPQPVSEEQFLQIYTAGLTRFSPK